jgi:hypothetical protein
VKQIEAARRKTIAAYSMSSRDQCIACSNYRCTASREPVVSGPRLATSTGRIRCRWLVCTVAARSSASAIGPTRMLCQPELAVESRAESVEAPL